MQKTHQIVMLPTDKKSHIFRLYDDLWLTAVKHPKCDITQTIPQHLYVLSDEKINASDIIFWSMGNKGYIGVAGVDVIYNGNTKKVIATTDSSFTKKKQIKLIPYSFLPEFVDAWNKNKISEVELEYNDESDLKTNEANEVSISIQNVVLDNIQLASEQFNRTLDRNKKYGMNIIEAMQQAENGFAITNNFLKIEGALLLYFKIGFFCKYVLFDGEPLYLNTFDTLTTAQILCKSWEVLPENYRNKIFKNN